MEVTGTIPKGTDLLATLIMLLADQEGCKISFELEGGVKCVNTESEKTQ